jgi:hypothetical protein
MDAIRCLDCGDVRWSLIGLKGGPGTCEICDGEMVPERRRPAGTGRFQPSERRDLVPLADDGHDSLRFHQTA